MAKPEACPFCGDRLVWATKPPGAKVAIIGTEPGKKEMKTGIPFIGSTGQLFRAELIRHGIAIGRLLRGNLWLHPIPKKVVDQRQEIDWHKRQLFKALKGVKSLMLMGAANSRIFLDCGIMEVSSLEVKLSELPSSIETVTMSVNPAQTLHGPVGELRLATARFAERSKQWL